MRSGYLFLASLLIAVQAVTAFNEPYIEQQIFEIEFNPLFETSLSHHVNIRNEENWGGVINFTYPFGTFYLFASPEEILDWEKKVIIEATGCDSAYSFDVTEKKTVVTVEVCNGTENVDITIRMKLTGMVESVKGQSFPLINQGGEKERFSFVTAISNLGVNQTKVIVHLPESRILSNYLPLQNVTVLKRGSDEKQSVFWNFAGAGAVEARVFVEFGTKGKMGRLMILILVVIVLGVVLAAFKFLLILDEENLAY